MMEACKDLPELTLNVKEDQNEVFKLLDVIKPNWKKEKVTIKVLSGGKSCCMLSCSHDSGEAVTVRVRNHFDGMRNPADEHKALQVISAKGYFPPLLAVFQNGVCYEYIPGRPLFVNGSKEVVIDENQTKLVAQHMANIHSTPPPDYGAQQESYFDFFVKLISEGKPWYKGCPSIDELKKEVRLVEEFVKKMQSPSVFCHVDPHSANIVWDEEHNKMTFVDWEMSRVAPRGCDIAFFLNSIVFCGEVLDCPVKKPDNHERMFCEFYLQRWNDIQGKPSPTTEEIEQLLLEFNYFSLSVNLAWIIWNVWIGTNKSDFKISDRYLEITHRRYSDTKERLSGVRTFGSFTKE